MFNQHLLKFVLAGITLILCSCAQEGPRVLHEFREASVPATITPIGGAKIRTAYGRLYVSATVPGGGIRVEVPPQYQCVAFEDVLLADSDPGDSITWKWIVRDETKTEFTLLESVWTHTQSTRFTTTKKDKNGRTVQIVTVISDETVNKFRPFRTAFDRRVVNGVEQVQLEFRHPTSNAITRLFPWQDPDPTTTVAFEITSTLPEFSIGSVGVNTGHDDSAPDAVLLKGFRTVEPGTEEKQQTESK